MRDSLPFETRPGHGFVVEKKTIKQMRSIDVKHTIDACDTLSKKVTFSYKDL